MQRAHACFAAHRFGALTQIWEPMERGVQTLRQIFD